MTHNPDLNFVNLISSKDADNIHLLAFRKVLYRLSLADE